MSIEHNDIDTLQSEEEIRLFYEEYGESLIASDADRYGAIWTENGIRKPPDKPNIEGRIAIQNGI